MDRYGFDVLANSALQKRALPRVPAKVGLVVEDVETGWVGAIVRVERTAGMNVVLLEDRHGKTRSFPLGPGFWIDGRPVELIPRVPAAPKKPARTASGSIAVTQKRARVARGSRIWVEGRHDAELVEKVWGDDLRIEGVVVEYLEGIDHLVERLAKFGPAADRRVGVLVDHLVSGSKESRIAKAVQQKFDSQVLVLGHPYVDVWQAVRAERVGLKAWPQISRDIEWKRGMLAQLGLPNSDQIDIANGWKWILSRVRDYRDLDAALLGRVEELIDFVTQ